MEIFKIFIVYENVYTVGRFMIFRKNILVLILLVLFLVDRGF